MEPITIRYGAFWRRAVAFIIDIVIVAVLFTFIANAISPQFVMVAADVDSKTLKPILGPLFFSFMWLYGALFESSGMQATPGKWVMQIKVSNLSGHRISFWKATARFLGKLISQFTVVGFLVALFTQKKQALHDLIAKTLVLKSK